MTIKDVNGQEIKVGDELNVPLDVFSTGVVVKNNKGELCLELRYEGNLVPVKDLRGIQVLNEVID